MLKIESIFVVKILALCLNILKMNMENLSALIATL